MTQESSRNPPVREKLDKEQKQSQMSNLFAILLNK